MGLGQGRGRQVCRAGLAVVCCAATLSSAFLVQTPLSAQSRNAGVKSSIRLASEVSRSYTNGHGRLELDTVVGLGRD
jgi:hypothetical protein